MRFYLITKVVLVYSTHFFTRIPILIKMESCLFNHTSRNPCLNRVDSWTSPNPNTSPINQFRLSWSPAPKPASSRWVRDASGEFAIASRLKHTGSAAGGITLSWSFSQQYPANRLFGCDPVAGETAPAVFGFWFLISPFRQFDSLIVTPADTVLKSKKSSYFTCPRGSKGLPDLRHRKRCE